MDQWMGALFFRGEPTYSINRMGYKEMKYWNSKHELISKTEVDAINKAKEERKK